jgi:hypothetical protein
MKAHESIHPSAAKEEEKEASTEKLKWLFHGVNVRQDATQKHNYFKTWQITELYGNM